MSFEAAVIQFVLPYRFLGNMLHKSSFMLSHRGASGCSEAALLLIQMDAQSLIKW